MIRVKGSPVIISIKVLADNISAYQSRKQISLQIRVVCKRKMKVKGL